MRRPIRGRYVAAALLTSLACSPKHLAEQAVAGALAGQNESFLTDDDPQLVAAATPFGLKLMESLLLDLPKHRGLLLSACSGFVGYGFAFVSEDADEASDPALARAGHERLRRLYARAQGYCLRGLEVAHPGLVEALTSGDSARRAAALAKTNKDDVPLLYWSAASWSLLISQSLSSLELIGQFPAAISLAERARDLEPTWSEGVVFDYLVPVEALRGVDQGGGPVKAKAALDRSLELSHGTRLGPILGYAETVQLPSQDRAGFEGSVARVLNYDVDRPEARQNRLANLLVQRRARWLRSRLDELFL